MSKENSKRDILVTNALPYANGPLHIGHLLEHIQSDIWVRYQRLIGNNCTYICGEDAHGTAIMLKAEENKLSPEELIEQVKISHMEDFLAFNISHDNYHTTHSEENRFFSEIIFTRLKEKGFIEEREIEQLFDTERQIFLSDRYVKGTCPSCGAEDQYGDNCEICSSTYSATDLIDPISVITETKPEIKKSSHLFFKLSDLKSEIKDWLDNALVPRQALNKLSEWIDGDLKDWNISRDEPYFGFKIPGYPGKYFYVWLDAPIGYLASHKNYLDKLDKAEDFDLYWGIDSKAELYHFIGKDIMYFHALFFPAMLLKSDFRQPSGVFIHGFLTVDGQKMSKSRGTFILASTYREILDPVYLRYYFAAKLGTGVDDIDLNLEDFCQRANSDLVGKFINIGSRTAKFINENFKNKLSKTVHNETLINEFIDRSSVISEAYENREFNKAIREIMFLADKANRYIDKMEPWVLFKDKKNKELVQSVCTTSLNLFRLMAIMLSPVIPTLSEKIYLFLNIKFPQWNDMNKILLNHEIGVYKPLLTRIEMDKIEKIREKSKEL
ncbi:MAG TPA: methionine--tRNA ligase [Gammaproteobacteria bacterium]|nr:methionine--tRNA ligase [Gammaproteobacteria bacterium]